MQCKGKDSFHCKLCSTTTGPKSIHILCILIWILDIERTNNNLRQKYCHIIFILEITPMECDIRSTDCMPACCLNFVITKYFKFIFEYFCSFSLFPLHAPSHCLQSCARHLIGVMKFQIRTIYCNANAKESNNHICHRYVYHIFVHSNTFGAFEFDFIAVLISKYFSLLPFVRVHFFVSSRFSTCCSRISVDFGINSFFYFSLYLSLPRHFVFRAAII